MFFNRLITYFSQQCRQPSVDNMHLMPGYFWHNPPLTGSFSWLLPGARKPLKRRFSHVWPAGYCPGTRFSWLTPGSSSALQRRKPASYNRTNTTATLSACKGNAQPWRFFYACLQRIVFGGRHA